MHSTSNPFEIARETLRQLAARRIAPTPDNYLTLYQEISGTKITTDAFPEKQLRSLTAALPRISPDQLRLARQLDEAVKATDWEKYKDALSAFIVELSETQKLAWSDLISNLLRQWDARHTGLTVARKREALEHVLTSSKTNPETLFTRLQNLLRSWGEGQERERGENAPASTETEIALSSPLTASTTSASTPAPGAPDFLPELKELFAFTLETAVATLLADAPTLANTAQELARDIRQASSSQHLEEFLGRLKRFAFKLELHTEDQAELRQSLFRLLTLLVENITGLILDDRWLQGQIEVVRKIIENPLSQRTIDDAERRLKEVLYKQSQLRASLLEAKEAIRHMLAGFVDHLAEFSDATSDYHDKIDRCAQKISAAQNINELEAVISEVMRETRSIRENAQRSRDELRHTQDRVRQAEARIQELEEELEATSELVRNDPLTGVLNRRGLDDVFIKEITRARRHEHNLCVGLIDIDNFKKLNDSLGHSAGDQALIHLADVCRQTLRPQDFVARYGGEEFVVLLPETELDDAANALTRLQRELTKRFFLHNNEKILITFSAGVTQLKPEDTPGSALNRADEAMYQAKQSGKNRVITAPPPESTPHKAGKNT